MFEKEAEKAGNEKIRENNQFARCARKSYKDGFKDGAEFGYNKANKWHYVKDGDLPKENKICLLYLGRSFNPTTGWIDNDIWYFEDNRKNSVWQTKVIAWKEITPPKEVKENEN